MQLDTNFVRAQFPQNHWHWAFFENAGGAFVPYSVIQRMTEYMTENQVQPGYPAGPSTQAKQRMDAGHHLMAEMIGAAMDEVTVSASTSINVYVLAQALRPLWQAGDEILVSNLNHEANSGPWRRLQEFGLKIVEWPVTTDAGLDMAALPALLSERTRLVAFPHVSNITGELNDVPGITRMAHEQGALVCVDGVAAAPHRAVEAKEWDVDFYLFSFYKVFGPHLGCLYGKRDHLLEARGQYHYFFPEDDLLHKLNPAGPNHESMAALVGISDYFDTLALHHGLEITDKFERTRQLYQLFIEHEELLARRFADWANSKERVRIIGPATGDRNLRVPTFSLLLDGVPSADAARKAAELGVAIGFGHFYAKRLLESLGIADTQDGVLRCSMAHYNTLEEVDRLTSALDTILGK